MMRVLTVALMSSMIAEPALCQTNNCDVASGLGTHACTFPEGQVVIETDIIDRTIDHGDDVRSNSLLLGDTLIHIGLRRGIEVQVGWTAYDLEHTHLPNGETLRSSGIGDVTIGGKFQIVNPADHAFGLSFQPTVSIPTGELELGAHGLGGSLLLAMSYDLTDTLTLELTPQANLVGDRTDDQRSWEYGATAGLVWSSSNAISATAEYRRLRQDDPGFRRTSNVAALSVGWFPVRKLQLNIGGAAGLDRRSPKLELLAGFALHLS